MEPIRVLQVVGRMDRGGIESFIMNVYRNIDRTKVQFDFLTHYGKEGAYNSEIRKLGGKIYDLPPIKSIDRTYYHKIFQYKKALNDFFREHTEYEVVHGHMTNTASIYMPIAKKHGIKCCIAHSHLSKARRGVSGLVSNILQLPVEGISDEKFACSIGAAEWLFSKKAINQKQVKLINNAIDTDLFKLNKEKRIIIRNKINLSDKFVVGHVGRFFHEKNHDFLIDIFSEVVKLQPDSVLLLIGEGTLRPVIEEKVRRLHLSEKVKFLGARSDVADLMQAMDIFVFPSFFEGLPVVSIEAQASGLPCVVSNTITNEIDVTGLVEFISLNSNPKTWAKKLIESSHKYERKDTSQKLINNGYDIKSTAAMLENFYINKHKK